MAYSDFFDDQEGTSIRELWGYTCWHALVHGGFVISDSWWKNNRSIDRELTRPLLDGGLGIVAMRDVGAESDAPECSRIPWDIVQVGENFSGLVDAILERPEEYLRLHFDEGYRPEHLACFRLVASSARDRAARRLDEGQGPRWARQDFYVWTSSMGEDEATCRRIQATLGPFLDHPYRQNFQTWLQRTYGHDAVVARRNRDVSEWLTREVPFLSAVNGERSAALGEASLVAWSDWGEDEPALFARWFLFMEKPELGWLGDLVRDPATLLEIASSDPAREWFQRRQLGSLSPLEYRRLAGDYFQWVVDRLCEGDVKVAGLRARAEAAAANRRRIRLAMFVLGPAAAGLAALSGLGEWGVAGAFAGGSSVHVLELMSEKFLGIGGELQRDYEGELAKVRMLIEGERGRAAREQASRNGTYRTSLGPADARKPR